MLYSCYSLGAVYSSFTAYTERAFLQHARLFKHPLMVLGSFGLALYDEEFRPIFGDLAKVGVGGYLGRLLPELVK
ncbi:MAG: hypothetical protein QNJ47_09105 [Nostocaceae cyanobacterium]|nr:hypothetical protein [Nostocaceae cyanobacterium]